MELKKPGPTIPDHIIEQWQRVVDAIAELLCVPSAMINRVEPPDLEIFRSNIGPDNPFPSGTSMPLAGVYCEMAAKRRALVQVTDAREDPEWADSPTAKAGIFAYMGYPLLWPNGEIFGTICVVDNQKKDWNKSQENLLMTFKQALEAHLALAAAHAEMDQKNRELQRAMDEIKTLQGLLPICVSCKKIRDDKGYWNQIETYIKERSHAEFSHSICPDCAKKLYPEFEIH